eukprot:766624-Hanusia_phi.AAC.1
MATDGVEVEGTRNRGPECQNTQSERNDQQTTGLLVCFCQPLMRGQGEDAPNRSILESQEIEELEWGWEGVWGWGAGWGQEWRRRELFVRQLLEEASRRVVVCETDVWVSLQTHRTPPKYIIRHLLAQIFRLHSCCETQLLKKLDPISDSSTSHAHSDGKAEECLLDGISRFSVPLLVHLDNPPFSPMSPLNPLSPEQDEMVCHERLSSSSEGLPRIASRVHLS